MTEQTDLTETIKLEKTVETSSGNFAGFRFTRRFPREAFRKIIDSVRKEIPEGDFLFDDQTKLWFIRATEENMTIFLTAVQQAVEENPVDLLQRNLEEIREKNE